MLLVLRIFDKKPQIMATLTFEIEVDDKTAERVRQNEGERIKVKLLIESYLENPDREASKRRLLESMSRLSDEAQKNGLTEEKLAEILEEIDRERA